MKLFHRKIKSSYIEPVKKTFKLFSYNPDNVFLYGSYSYKDMKYPGDIDTLEEVSEKSGKDIINHFVKKFQNIIKNIIHTKGFYLGDVKAGFDNVFRIPIGELKVIRNSEKLIGYNPKLIKSKLSLLYKNRLLNNDDYHKILKMVTSKIDRYHWDELYNTLRNHWILRWDASELLKGYKILSGNRKFTLEDAFKQESLIKIDVWANIYGKYIEITNLFVFAEKLPNGKLKFLNINWGPMEQGLKQQIRTLKSEYKFNPFKMTKRLWVLATRVFNDAKMAKITETLLNSDVGILYMVKSEIETIILMLKNVKNPPMDILLKQINKFKDTLSYISTFDFKEEIVDKIIDSISSGNLDKKQMNDALIGLNTYFKNIINEKSVKYLNHFHLLPPPDKYVY